MGTRRWTLPISRPTLASLAVLSMNPPPFQFPPRQLSTPLVREASVCHASERWRYKGACRRSCEPRCHHVGSGAERAGPRHAIKLLIVGQGEYMSASPEFNWYEPLHLTNRLCRDVGWPPTGLSGFRLTHLGAETTLAPTRRSGMADTCCCDAGPRRGGREGHTDAQDPGPLPGRRASSRTLPPDALPISLEAATPDPLLTPPRGEGFPQPRDLVVMS
jgi:hypothetical protein